MTAREVRAFGCLRSRLHSVSDGTNSAAYSYLANSSLVSNIVFQQSGATRMITVKAYDNLNRLTSIYSVNASSAVLDSHGYAYNAANQRTSVTNADGTYWVYQYDSLGQVISGVKYWSNGMPVAGQQFGYSFDTIGNRTATSAGGDQWGRNLRYATYGANSLNQYTNRTVPGAVDIIGSATNTATVTVNNQPTYRNGSYYRAQLSLNNSTGPVWQSVTNLAVLNQGGTNQDIVATNTGSVFLPQALESFTYDADGNLQKDGRWTYTWDGENRLLCMSNNANVPNGAKMVLNFSYDHRGRRNSKAVSQYNGSGYTLATQLAFVYDGWNLVAELNGTGLVRSYMWGTDLSGSAQGAGGVGGLLKITAYGASTTNAFVAYDANGNVAGLVSAADGTVLASYEYGSFGELIRADRSLAKINLFRFSSKYQDDETGLLYYGYRYYDYSRGRWKTRDPLAEIGGDNLYAFCQNMPISDVDSVGEHIASLEIHHGGKAAIPDAEYTTLGIPDQDYYNKILPGDLGFRFQVVPKHDVRVHDPTTAGSYNQDRSAMAAVGFKFEYEVNGCKMSNLKIKQTVIHFSWYRRKIYGNWEMVGGDTGN